MEEKKKVGFKSPPLETRFQKGQSGNPKGRPVKHKNASTLLADELQKKIVVRENGREKEITKLEALVTSLVNDAIHGKNNGRALLLKLLDVSTPVEPFVPNPADNEAFSALVNRLGNKPLKKDDADD